MSEAKGDQRRAEVSAGRVSLGWVGNLALELEQDTWHFPSSERDEKKGRAGNNRGRQKNGGDQSLGHQASSAVRGGSSSGHGLDDHRLQESEAHHEVQWDGWLQEVPVQPQVAQVRHVLQVRGEVVESHQVVGANLGPVDF